MSQLDTRIGPKIKAFRRQLGIQANKLAEQLNISPSYLTLIEGGKRKIDADLLIKICEELKIEISDLTTKADLNLENNISELLDDQLFEDLDILGPEVRDLVNTNPKIARALIKLGDNYKKKDQEIVSKVENLYCWIKKSYFKKLHFRHFLYFLYLNGLLPIISVKNRSSD